MKKQLTRVGEAAKILNLTPQTIRNYKKEGKLKGYPTPGGQTLYSLEETENLLCPLEREDEADERAVHYARSSAGPRQSLESQLEKLRKKFGEPDFEVKDRSSGLNETRPGLKKIIKMAKNGETTKIRVTQKDRLSRFGNEYLKELFGAYGVETEAAFETPGQELK